MQKHEDNLATQVDGAGLVPMPGVTVTVIDQSTGLAAALYSDNGVTPITMPIVTDNTGYYGFFAADGRYTITFTNPRIVTFTRDVILEDPKDNPYATLAQLAAPTGSTNIGNGMETVSDSFNALQLADYTALRAYGGPRKSVYVTGYLVTAAPSGIAGMFVRDDSDTATADNGGTVIVASNGKRWKRVIANVANIRWFGAAGDGTTDDTGAWNLLVASGHKNLYVPTGRYVLNKANTANLTNAGLSNLNIYGDGPSSVLFLYGKNWCFTSPSHVTFRDLRFEGNPANTDIAGTPTSIWCSNYTDITFDNCEFANFGNSGSTLTDGTVCLYMYAGPTSSVAAGGNSAGAVINNCRFYGSSRKTNFGVRVFTEWASGASLAYSNTGVIIANSTFGGFNWNAVELAGPMTSNCLISNCVGNANGLTPFDIDKGANNCRIQNVAINRLLGNADTSTSPNTRIAVASIQGETNVGRIAWNNHIDGVVANLLVADLNAFPGTGGASAVGVSNVQNCSIRNVKVNLDAVPTRYAGSVFPGAFAVACFEHISGCKFADITTTNASVGIVETAANNGTVGTSWNRFRDIRNHGTMKGECFYIGMTGSNVTKNHFTDIKLETDMSVYIDSSLTAVNIKYAGSALVANTVLMNSFERVYVHTPGYSVLNGYCTYLSLKDFYVDYDANNTHINFFATTTGCVALNYAGVYFNGKPLDVYNAFQRLPSACKVGSVFMADVPGAMPYVGAGVPMYATAAPTNPAAANWAPGTVVFNVLPSGGGTPGWVGTGGAFKAMANLAA